jgi:hypothetical protein
MPRPITAPARALIASEHFVPHVRVQLADQADAWQDVSDVGGRDYFLSATWRESIDAPVMSGAITLSRSVDGVSIAPTMSASAINHPGGGAYDPFIRGRQHVRILTACKAPGVAPLPDDWIEQFVGRVDTPEWGGNSNVMTLPIADVGTWLMGKMIEVETVYSDDVGVPIETVMQQILDDNVVDTLGAVTLHVPVSPGINIKAYTQSRVPVLQALRDLAQQLAWEVRYRYDDDGIFKLTLYEPDRDKDVADWEFGPDEYMELPQVGVNTDDIRNKVRVYYIDATTGERAYEEYEDASSIALNDVAYLEIGESATSNIDSGPEALTMATGIGKDLSTPFMTQQMISFFSWFVQLGDLGNFLPNGMHYDETQSLAIVAIEHNLTRESKRTTLSVRGQPAGQYANWLQLAHTSSGVPLQKIGRPSVSAFVHDDTHQVDAIVDVDSALTASIKVLASGTHVPTSAEVRATAAIATGGASRVTVVDVIDELLPGVTGYISALAYDAAGNESAIASAAVSLAEAVLPPTIEMIVATPNSINGLTVDVALRIIVPSGEAATLYLYLNHDGTGDPAYTADPEYNLAIPAGATEAAPYIVDETVDFLNYPSEVGTFKALNDVRVHPTQFKLVYAKVTDASGLTSGKMPFTVRGGGGSFDASGNLKAGAIFAPSQITDGLLTLPLFDPTLKIPVQYGSLPATGPQGVDSLAIVGGRTSKWTGSAWVDVNSAANLVGQLVTSQITPGSITQSLVATGLRIPQTGTTFPGSGTIGDTFILQPSGVLYRWNGSTWTADVGAGFIAGQLLGTQIADLAISTPKIALGAITSPLIAAGVVTADKLFVYGTRGAALNLDPNTSDASAWIDDITGNNPTLINFGAAGKTGQWALVGSTYAYLRGRALIAIDPTKTYRVRAWIYADSANGLAYTGVFVTDATGAQVASPIGGGWYAGAVGSNPTNGTWTEYVGYLGAGAPPQDSLHPGPFTSACKWMTPYVLLNYGGSVGSMYAQDVRVEEVTPGTLIMDGAITTGKVAALSITSSLLAANAAIFGKVAAGAIGTDQLIAYSITSGKVAAGAITTDKLYVSGGFGQALNADPELRDATAWALGSASQADFGTGGKTGRYGLRSNVGVFGQAIANVAIAVDPLKVYRFHVWLRMGTGTDGIFYYGGTFKNGDGTDSNSNSGYCYAAGSGTRPSSANVWQEYTGNLLIADGSIPSTAAYFYPILYLNYGGTAGYMDVQDFRVEEVLPGTLIIDGSITTAKVAALQITSDQLAANSAIFGKVAAGAIGVDQMRANSVGADQIIAGSIQADKLLVTMSAGSALNSDPLTTDVSAWLVDINTAGSSVIADMAGAAKVGRTALYTGGNGYLAVRDKRIMRLDFVTKTYRLHAWVYNGSATGTIYLGVYMLNKFDVAVGGVYAVGNEHPASGVWTEYNRTINAATFTTWSQDAAQVGGVQLYALLNYPGSTTGFYWLQDFRLEEVIPGTLIKDGSILTQHLTSTTVTAGVMNVATISSISPDFGVMLQGQLNGPSGMYLNLSATAGNPVLHGSQFNLNYDGSATFAGALVAATGSFAGSLSAATGTFAGSLSAATGSFAGSLSAASGSFAGALSGATGTFSGDVTASGSISAGAFYSTYSQFSGRIVMRGTIRLLADSTYADAGDAGLLFYRDDLGYVYGKIQMDAGTANVTMQANGGLNLDAGSGSNNVSISAYAVTIDSIYNSLATMFQVSNSTYGTLFTVDVPTNNNDTGLSVIYRNESGAYSFKRIRGDNTNTGGSGSRNLRVLN